MQPRKPSYGFEKRSDFIRTQRAVLKVERQAGAYEDNGRVTTLRRFHVKFTEDLEGTDDYNVPTSAKAIILTGHRDDDELGEFANTAGSGLEVTVYNRSPATKAIDDYATATEFEYDDKLYLEATAGGGDCCDCCDFVPESDIILTDGVKARSKIVIKIRSSPKRINAAGTAYVGLTDFDYIASYTTSGPDGREGWMVPTSILHSMIFAESVATGTPAESSRISSIVANLWVVYTNSDTPLPYPATTLHFDLDAVIDLAGLEDPPV